MKSDKRGALTDACLILLLLTITKSLVPAYLVRGSESTPTEGPLSYEDILRGNYLNLSRVEEHIRYFTSNCTPRVTGYSGFYKAQEYIYQKFEDYGLEKVQYQWYNITIPVDLGGELKVYHPDGTLIKTYPVHHLWPNSIQVSSTPIGGVTGTLFYAGEGDYADYNGHVVDGSIVILDFNTGHNWLKAMELGAQAIVFIEPDITNNMQGLTKYLSYTPIYAPRVYLQKEHASDLLLLLNQQGGELDVKLESRMEWQVKEVANVVGFSPGTGTGTLKDGTGPLKDQWIILFAHFDSWSVVPSLTEGATDACGMAALLEMIRFFTEVEHGRSIMFVAFSGHGQGIYGARHFVDSLLVGDAFPEVLPRDSHPDQGIFFIAGIDLSPETDSVGPTPNGDFYYGTGLAARWKRTFYGLPGGFVYKMSDAWNTVYGRTWRIPRYDILGLYWVAFFPSLLIVDANAWVVGGGKLTYRTVYAWFDKKYTPLDTFTRLDDLNNLKPQLEFIACTTYDLAYKTEDYKPTFILTHEDIHWEGWGGPQFYRLTGQAITYNESAATYEPLPNAMVQIYIPGYAGRMFHSLTTWFETADEEGRFTAKVVRGITHFYPYLINKTTSQTVYAPDFGRYGAAKFSHQIMFMGDPNPLWEAQPVPYPSLPLRQERFNYSTSTPLRVSLP